MPKIIKTFIYGGCEFQLESGELAKQANASVLVKAKETEVLVTVVASKKPAEKPGMLPLRVDYQYKAYAAGGIPGGFFRREGRPTEFEILVARLIDRSIRPLFDEHFNHEIQVVATALSVNPEMNPDILALIGASAALSISGLPFNGPIAAARVGYIDEQLVINPLSSQLANSKLDLVVAGTSHGVLMVESQASELSEQTMLAAVTHGHEQMQSAITAINALKDEIGAEPFEWKVPSAKDDVAAEIEKIALHDLAAAYQIHEKSSRKTALAEVGKKVEDYFLPKIAANEVTNADVAIEFSKLEEKIVRQNILKHDARIDGRSLTEIRPITVRTSLLPRVHGSALFTRGETQVLGVATLGSTRDAQSIESFNGEVKKHFMLHYNFPPYSVGEVGMIGSPKRREIGHGALAERAISAVLPMQTEFPYVIRVVAETLESNGSSSMASVCATSLALMDAGVPIKAPVAGIAMGLIKEGENYKILSDILGDEDHLGDMDFKVAGTEKGVTALQMDLKIDNISPEVMARALDQAKNGRLHILNVMNQVCATHRESLSSYAPRITVMTISPDRIKDVIGKGGATIRGIIEETGATIDIEDTGVVKIAAVSEESANQAIARITELTSDVEVDRVYAGKVVKITDFGAFVAILPGREGLLHISQISDERVENVADKLSEGQHIAVKVIALDRQGRIKLSMKGIDDDTNKNVEA